MVETGEETAASEIEGSTTLNNSEHSRLLTDNITIFITYILIELLQSLIRSLSLIL